MSRACQHGGGTEPARGLSFGGFPGPQQARRRPRPPKEKPHATSRPPATRARLPSPCWSCSRRPPGRSRRSTRHLERHLLRLLGRQPRPRLVNLLQVRRAAPGPRRARVPGVPGRGRPRPFLEILNGAERPRRLAGRPVPGRARHRLRPCSSTRAKWPTWAPPSSPGARPRPASRRATPAATTCGRSRTRPPLLCSTACT